MRVIFVGIHNKPDTPPLCSTTRTGKLIDRVIDQIDIECLKTNLFDDDSIPKEPYLIVQHLVIWFYKNMPINGEVIVLLGKDAQKNFVNAIGMKVLNFPHPASIRSNYKKDLYVNSMVKAINQNR